MKARTGGPVLVLVLSVAAAAGCGSIHSQRRATPADLCAGSLPAAQTVAGSGARLVHLKRLSPNAAGGLLAGLHAPPLASSDKQTSSAGEPATTSTPNVPAAPEDRPTLCVLAYRGTFTAGRLPAALPHSGDNGHVLLLIATTRHPRVLSAVVLDALPASVGR